MNGIIEGDRKDRCFLCGRSGTLHVHHIFGGSVRKNCDKRKLIVHLCACCHAEIHDSGSESSRAKMQYLHEVGQRTYEAKIGTREQFLKEFIRSYL